MFFVNISHKMSAKFPFDPSVYSQVPNDTPRIGVTRLTQNVPVTVDSSRYAFICVRCCGKCDLCIPVLVVAKWLLNRTTVRPGFTQPPPVITYFISRNALVIGLGWINVTTTFPWHFRKTWFIWLVIRHLRRRNNVPSHCDNSAIPAGLCERGYFVGHWKQTTDIFAANVGISNPAESKLCST